MKIINEPSFVDGMPVRGHLVKTVKKSPNFGSTISNDREVDDDVNIRLQELSKLSVV